MFEEIIEFDEKKIKERNLDINKINAYLDEIHDVPEIKKKRDGHYVGVTCSTELARFGNAIMVCQETEWFRNIIKTRGAYGPALSLCKGCSDPFPEQLQKEKVRGIEKVKEIFILPPSRSVVEPDQNKGKCCKHLQAVHQ